MRIAIVGAGVSGLVAAHLLAREHEVVIYEAGSYAGGHTNTIRVDTAHETHHIDTGFIVMNDRNYPNFTRLLHQLGVATQDTNMSFSVKGEDEDFEYAGTPRGLFCQPSNLLSPRFQRMIADLLRFNRELRRLLARDETGVGVQGGRAPHGRVAAGLPRAAALLRGLRPPADRPPGLGRVVGRPAPDLLVPRALPRRVLRQPRDARLPRPPALVDRRRRLGALRRGAHTAAARAYPARLPGAFDHPRRGPRRDRRRRSAGRAL